MSIKTKNSRDTYRSNVKARPLRQNGLEAQYQGLDVREVNIDHSGLPILARGGFQNPRNFTKVFKEYIVDLDADEHYPRAALMFENDKANWSYTAPSTYVGINRLASNNVTFTLTDSGGTDKTFHYTTDTTNTNGLEMVNPSLTADDIAVVIPDDSFSYRDTMMITTASIISAFGKETFTFQIMTSGSIETVDMSGRSNGGIFRVTETEENKTLVPVAKDKILISLKATAKGSAALATNNASFFDVTTDTFGDQSEKHRWRLNSFREQTTNDQMFYEDLRTDILQSFAPHERRKEGTLFKPIQQSRGALDDGSTSNGFARSGNLQGSRGVTSTDTTGLRVGQTLQKILGQGTFGEGAKIREIHSSTAFDVTVDHVVTGNSIYFRPLNDGFHKGANMVNADDHMNSRPGTGTSLDPRTLGRFTTQISDELLIRQTPKRQEVFGTFRDNHAWREDRHFLSMVDQRWEQIEQRALLYDSDFESHMIAMLDTNFADEQYFEDNPLSGRVDVFGRLSRVFDTHNEIIYERHRGSIFDQFLDPIDDFRNLQDNKYPKADETAVYTQIVYNHTTLVDEQINHTNDPAFEDVQGKRRVLQEDQIGVSVVTFKLTTAPDQGDQIVLHVGNGWSADTSIEIKFNFGGNHDNSVQPLGSSGSVDLEIDLNDPSVVSAEAFAQHIVDKLSPLQTSAVNEVDLKYYSVTRDIDEVIITALRPGVGWNITVPPSLLINTMDAISYTTTSGIDSLWARENSIMFMDYFDQLPMEKHDYSETERYTRIDDEMLSVLTFDANRNTHIDRREWQESDYLYTSTGFASSQVTPQDGIIYREMKR